MKARAKKNNLERMIQLAQEFFDVKNDPSQISVTEETMEKLRKIHPDTLNEKASKDGPVAWVLLLPTTNELMKQFLRNRISEQQLLEKTPVGGTYDAIYLCSALVLPEYRGKGLARKLIYRGIRFMRNQHPVKCLFFWAFSIEGSRLAASVAKELDLPLYERSPD